jgi:hypothetical protein
MGIIGNIIDKIKDIIAPPKPSPAPPIVTPSPPSPAPPIVTPSPPSPAPSPPSGGGGGSRPSTPVQYIDPKTGQGYSGIPPSNNVIVQPITDAGSVGGSSRNRSVPDNKLNLPIEPDNKLIEAIKKPSKPSITQMPVKLKEVEDLPYQKRGTGTYNPITKEFEKQRIEYVPELSKEGGFTFEKASEIIPTGVYNVGRKIFPEKTTAKEVDYDPSFRYYVGGTKNYNPITKEFEKPTGEIQVQTFTSSIPSTLSAGSFLGQYFIPVYGATLFAGVTAEGGKKVYSGVQEKDTQKILQGALQVAPAVIIGGVVLKRFVSKPRIKILEPARTTEPVSQEIQWLNPQTGKIEAIKAEGYMALPPKVRIENLFFTKYEGYIGKPKTYIEFTPKATELGKPVVTFQQKVGSKYGDFFLSKSEEMQGVSVRLGRGYLNKPNEVFIPKDGKRLSTFSSVIGTTETKAVDNLLVTQFKSYGQDISLPSSFQKATGVSARKKVIQESRGTIIRILPVEDSSILFKTGTGTKSSANYFQELYQQQGASQLIFPSKVKPIKYSREQILKKTGVEETPASLSAFSQYKYGWGYSQAGGTYKENIADIGTNIQPFSFEFKSLEKSTPDIKDNILEVSKESEFILDKGKSDIKEDMIFGNIDITNVKQQPSQKTPQRERERIAEIVGTSTAQPPAEKLIYPELVRPRIPKLPKPTLIKPPKLPPTRIPFKPSSSRTKYLFDKVTKAYDVIVFKRGKEQVIARNLPLGLAKKTGAKEVLSTLRASFKLKERGTTLMEDVDYELPFSFEPSKRDKSRFVQKLGTRLGTRSETREIQFFKKQKEGRIKWL